MIRVLFVCMGNICRSPTAEGVVASYIERNSLHDRVAVDSAGTHAFHVGERPDPRAQDAAKKRGFDLSRLRARRVVREDFARFDLILAMDRDNLDCLFRECPQEHRHKVRLLLSYARNSSREEVPDPYYGGRDGFEHVLDLVEDAAQGLIEDLRRT
ncbi:MAG: low molecular weight protein-tyrosine-phosphatase [Rhodocyclaceae bacterium]